MKIKNHLENKSWIPFSVPLLSIFHFKIVFLDIYKTPIREFILLLSRIDDSLLILCDFFNPFIIYHIGNDQNRGIDPSIHRKRLVTTSSEFPYLFFEFFIGKLVLAGFDHSFVEHIGIFTGLLVLGWRPSMFYRQFLFKCNLCTNLYLPIHLFLFLNGNIEYNHIILRLLIT